MAERRPDLEAAPFKAPSYITQQIFPSLFRAVRQGVLYWRDIVADSAAQTGRTAGAAPTAQTINDQTGVAVSNNNTVGLWVRVTYACDSTFSDTHACFAGVNLTDWTASYPTNPTIVNSTNYTAEGDGANFTASGIGVTHYGYLFIGNVTRTGTTVTIDQKLRSDVVVPSVAGFGTATAP